MEEILNKEQSLDELRQRINTRGEKIMKQWKYSDKKSWFFLIAIIALLLIFDALNYHCGWIDIDWRVLPAVILVAIVASLVIYNVMKHFLTKMKNANGPAQHLQAAKRFIKTMKWGMILISVFAASLIWLFSEGIYAMIFAFCCIFLFESIWVWFMPNMFIDKDFYKDVEELEEYV